MYIHHGTVVIFKFRVAKIDVPIVKITNSL